MGGRGGTDNAPPPVSRGRWPTENSRRCSKKQRTLPSASPNSNARRLFLSLLLLSSLEVSDTKICDPQVRALLGTASQFCEGENALTTRPPPLVAGGRQRTPVAAPRSNGPHQAPRQTQTRVDPRHGRPRVTSVREQLLSRHFGRFQGGLVFKAHKLLYHSTLGSRVTEK